MTHYSLPVMSSWSLVNIVSLSDSHARDFKKSVLFFSVSLSSCLKLCLNKRWSHADKEYSLSAEKNCWKRKWTNKDLHSLVLLAAEFQHRHGWKLDLAALARFLIPSLPANSFRPFVFCFLQPSSDPCMISAPENETEPPSLTQNYQIMLDAENRSCVPSGCDSFISKLWESSFWIRQFFWSQVASKVSMWDECRYSTPECFSPHVQSLMCVKVQISQREGKVHYSKRNNHNGCWPLLHFFISTAQ